MSLVRKILKEAKIEGGKADKLSLEDISKKFDYPLEELKKQLDMGKEVELEHTKDKSLAQDIAMDHLSEIPDYYTRLEKMESEGIKYWQNK
jgi:hypothetical protein